MATEPIILVLVVLLAVAVTAFIIIHRRSQKAQEALSLERNTLRTLVDAMLDPIFVKDTRGAYTLVNTAFLEAVKMGEEHEVLGSTDAELMPDYDMTVFAEEDRIVLQEGKAIHEERHEPHPNSEIEWVATTKVPMHDKNGRIIGLVSITRDITSFKRAEAELKRRVEQLSILGDIDTEINSSLDLDRVLQLGTDAAARMSLASAVLIAIEMRNGEMVVQHIIGTYPHDMLGQTLPSDRGITGRAIATRQPQLVPDVKHDPDFYEDIPETVSAMAIPLLTHDHLVGVICLETDTAGRFDHDTFEFMITLSKRLAIALDNARLYTFANERLEEAQALYNQVRILEQTKTEMIRMASHDLKTPVSVMAGFLSLFEEDKDQLSEAHQQFVELMQQANSRMQQMLEDILTLERIEQRAYAVEATTFDLKPLLTRAINEYRTQSMAKEQVFNVDGVSDVDEIHVKGDDAQIYEAVTNLISNAIKYTPDGGSISVSLSVVDSRAIFKVQDTGYGIPEDRQKRLFQPFYRAKSEGTEEIEGTGLGLYLVKSIIDRHFGDIIFSSKVGEGSTFGFSLPLDTSSTQPFRLPVISPETDKQNTEE